MSSTLASQPAAGPTGDETVDAIGEIRDENILREMWQDAEDPDEKRQLRSRMYKMREDRIKEYYGREGHEILESILRPDIEPEAVEELEGMKTTVQGNREVTVNSGESQSVDGTQTVKYSGIQVKQSVTSVTKSGGKSMSGHEEDLVKNRINKKDRTSQYKEIGTESKRRKGSSGEIEIINVKRASRSSVTTNNNNTNNKVVAKNIRNGMENGVSTTTNVQKKSRRGGEDVTKAVVNGKSSITTKGSNATTTIAGTKSISKGLTETNKVSTDNQSSTVTTVTRKHRREDSTMTTTKSSTTMMTSASFSQSSTNRIMSSSFSNKKEIISSGDIKSSSGTAVIATTPSGQIPLGSVHIEEILEKPVASSVVLKQTSSSARGTSASSGRQSKDSGNKSRQTKADSDVINRNLASSSSMGATQVTKSEMTKTSSSSNSGRVCSKSSSGNVNANSNANTSNGSAIKDKSSRVLDKSGESSAKRGKGQGRGSKGTPRTTESSQTPTIKVDRAETILPKGDNKTEESIIRELDILDTYLSQRSVSIEESTASVASPATTTASPTVPGSGPTGVKEDKILIGKVNGTMEVDHPRKAGAMVDVMESGLEAPFTKTEYKYGCPGEDGLHHPDTPGDKKNTNEGRKGKGVGKSGGRGDTTTKKSDDTRKSNIEDEIIVDEIRFGKSEGKLSTEKSVKLLRQKEIKTTTDSPTNLSSKGTSKTNIKKPSEPTEQTSKTTTAFSTGKSATTITGTTMDVLTKQQKYDADILSRPSVIQRKKSIEKPNPNPRVRKGSDHSSPERTTYTNRKFDQPQKTKPITDDHFVDEDEEDDDDPLIPEKRRGSGKLDSPGAVLKAKSLFETKAQEAAMDRSSADFDIDKGLSKSAKVSKKAALFEARSRGERVSISSESSVSVNLEGNKDQPQQQQVPDQLESQIKLSMSSEPEPIRPKETIVLKSDPVASTISKKSSRVTDTKKSEMVIKKSDFVREDKATVKDNSKKPDRILKTRKSEGAIEPKKPSVSSPDDNLSTLDTSVKKVEANKKSEVVSETKKSEIASDTKKPIEEKSSHKKVETEMITKASEILIDTKISEPRTGRRSSDTKPKVDNETKEKRKSRDDSKEASDLKQILERRRSSVRASSFLESKVEAILNKSAKTSSSIITTSQSASNSNRMTTTELNAIDSMEDIDDLEKLLEKATDYDERSKIRGRIRALKRKAALVKRPSTEGDDESPDRSVKRNVSIITSDENPGKPKFINNTNAKIYERRRSSGEIPSNKVTTRKKSSELNETQTSIKNIVSETRAGEIRVHNEEKTCTRRMSREKKMSTSEKADTAQVSQVETTKKIRRQKSSESPSPTRTVVKEKEEQEVKVSGERKLSSETQELLSTRKYSREKVTTEDEETINVTTTSGSPISSRRNSSKEILTPTSSSSTSPTRGSPGPDSTLKSRRDSREKNSPTRVLDSVPESKPNVEVKRTMTKAEKYEADILSRPSVFHNKRRQEQEAEATTKEKISESQSKHRNSRDSVSPQRSEIPISSRMKSARESSPPKTISEGPEVSSSETSNVEVSKDVSKSDLSKSDKTLKSESKSETASQKTSTKKVSSRKNSEELRGSKSNKPNQTEEPKGGSRKNSEDQSSSVSKVQRRQSTEESQNSSSSISKKNTYTRKTSSKELKSSSTTSTSGGGIGDSAEGQSRSSSRTTGKEKGETTKAHPKPVDDNKSTSEINSNQKQQSDNNPPTQSSTLTQQQKTTKESTRGQQGTRQTTSSSSSAHRVSSNSTTTSNKHTSVSSSSSLSNAKKAEGTESVITSSYGVGPTDDDGTPLFGLRALRKVKQVQEQLGMRESEKSLAAVGDGITTDEQRNKSSTLRSSENFGLRALKKGSTVSRGFENNVESSSVSVCRGKSPESSVPEGFTSGRGESKSESVLSSSQVSSSTSSRTSSRGDGTPGDQNRGGGISTSPKSILKKTSSFTSQSSSCGGGVVKSKTETESGSNNFDDEIGRDESGRESCWTADSAISNNNLDDSSWRRKSMSPSPPDGQGVGSFSRGKVGRSSVKEMSKRFETSETSLTSSTSNIPSTTSHNEHHTKTSFIRADSPSRIPSPVRSTTTTTTTITKSKEVKGEPDSSTISKTTRTELSDSEDNPEAYRVTRTTVTKRSGRSFLTDHTPIQNLSDVIDRMKGEDSRYADDFKADGESSSTATSEGLNLLNKFIGAQIIMQAVEPMLLSKKVSMSSTSESQSTSSLVINGVDVDSETDPAKLRQLLSETDGSDGERIEIRLKTLEKGESEEMRDSSPEEEEVTSTKVEEDSSPSSSSPVASTTTAAAAADVTGELMPLILGQLQSSLDSIGASSPSGSGIHIDSSIGKSSHNNNNNSTNSPHNSTNGISSSKCDDGGGGSISISADDDAVVGEGLEESEAVGSAEECLFDSGTESGEDVVSSPGLGTSTSSAPTVHHAKSVSSPAEFSNFMEGLRNTLKRNKTKESLLKSYSLTEPFSASAYEGNTSAGAFGVGCLISASSAGGKGELCDGTIFKGSSPEKESFVQDSTTSEDPDLIQQVDKVLTLLRDSLVKDPNCLKLPGIGELDLNPDPTKGKELIALIDRLKSSLTTTDASSDNKEKEQASGSQEIKVSPLPTVIGTSEEASDRRNEMFTWAQTRPPDIVPLPWVNHIQSSIDSKSSSRKNSGGDGVSWKGRGGKRRTHGRSHTVGVTQEELAEARRYLQESAYRNALEEEQKQFDKEKETIVVVGEAPSDIVNNVVEELSVSFSKDDLTASQLAYGGDETSTEMIINNDDTREQRTELVKQTIGRPSWQKDVEKGLTSIPRPFVKPGMYDAGFKPPPERRMTYATIDDSISVLGNSGGNVNATYAKIKPFRTISLDNAYDPSKGFFTKEETVQIAIHQAAIKKQVSEEEDRRKRRNSLSSYNNKSNIYEGGSPPGRDFSLALPKPYSSPQQQQQKNSNVSEKQQPDNAINTNGGGGSTGSRSYPAQFSTTTGDSGYTEESGSESRQARNDQLVLYQTSQISPTSTTSTPTTTFLQSPSNQQRIENVQISLKELNSSEFPQLQIAITLNTNNNNNNNSNSGNNGGNNSNSSESGQGNPQQQSTFHGNNNNINQLGNNNATGKQNNNFASDNNNMVVAQSTPSTTTTTNNKAMRYKSKNERKRRLKRANTIDIPQPPGFLLSNDDDSEMEDEEDSDGDNNSNHNNNISMVKTSQFTYAPFKPKSDGDRKFLAFLEKNNNAVAAENKPNRPAYLGVNDNFWNNRFFNLKSSFESSSQGSSPSASPIMSPNRPPRSVSEMALTHGITPSDTYSKPIWATTDPGQLPQQVKNKLQVFEGKNMESSTKEIPWRPSRNNNQNQNTYTNRSGANQLQQQQNRRSGIGNQFVSSSSVYSTNNVRPPMLHDQKPSFESDQHNMASVRRPVAMKPSNNNNNNNSNNKTPATQSHQPPQIEQRNSSSLPTQAVEGVHIVHATASALEAMKRSGFGPTAVVQPQRSNHSTNNIHHSSQPPPLPPKASSLQQEKIELPWAKKEPMSPSEGSARDLNAGRILMSKAKFEQMSQPELVPMAPAVAHPPVGAPPPIPPKSIKLVNTGGSNTIYNQHQPRASMQTGMKQTFPTASVPNVARAPGRGFDQQLNNNALYASGGGGIKAKLGSFEVTQSFDEDYKRRVENQPTTGRLHIMRSEPQVKEAAQRGPFGQVVQDAPSGVTKSAFARKVSASEPSSRRSSGQEDEEIVIGRKPSIGSDGVVIQTPVVAKVMRGPQQQRAGMTGNRMSSLNDDPQTSRLTNARSNIRNILNQYQQKSPTYDDSSDTSPPILKANLQLSLPPLTKSMSGDALLQTHFRPSSLIVGPEELSLQTSSPNLKHYSPTTSSVNTISPASLPASSPKQISPMRKESAEVPQQKLHNQGSIPKQRSLSEFPKIGSAPNIGVLTVQTDLESLGKAQSSKLTPQKSQQVPASPQQSKQIQPQSRPAVVQQRQQQQQPQLPSQEQSSRAPKVLKSYPATDSLQRTSSGSSIFNRAQSLFLSSQEGMPPASKSRPKPPTLPKTQCMFPKQFEAQMSPQSADKKQREIEAYFKQQQIQIQEQEQKQKQKQQSSQRFQAKPKGTILRKSASHSKIMNRQRSLSDGEEDVDQIFESLFKASALEKSLKSAELSEVPNPSKSVEMTSESKRVSSFNQSISVQSSSSSSISSSSSSSVSVGGGAGLNRFKAMDQQAKANSGGAPLFKFANPGLKASANSAKDILLYWTQCRTREYENVKIENFSSSWSDGLAFCALIHHFFPDAFDYNSLDAKNRRYNFDLAFRIADEKAGIYPLLDTEDMIVMGRRPDWKCVFTYVQAMYQKLKEFS